MEAKEVAKMREEAAMSVELIRAAETAAEEAKVEKEQYKADAGIRERARIPSMPRFRMSPMGLRHSGQAPWGRPLALGSDPLHEPQITWPSVHWKISSRSSLSDFASASLQKACGRSGCSLAPKRQDPAAIRPGKA